MATTLCIAAALCALCAATCAGPLVGLAVPGLPGLAEMPGRAVDTAASLVQAPLGQSGAIGLSADVATQDAAAKAAQQASVAADTSAALATGLYAGSNLSAASGGIPVTATGIVGSAIPIGGGLAGNALNAIPAAAAGIAGTALSAIPIAAGLAGNAARLGLGIGAQAIEATRGVLNSAADLGLGALNTAASGFGVGLNGASGIRAGLTTF